MRKVLNSVSALALSVVLLLSCSENRELKEAVAVVKAMTDSTVVATVDGSDATLVTTEVRITNGMYMPGDSVRLFYVGHLSSGKARAMLISLLPKRSNVVRAGLDNSRELMTADPEEDTKEQETAEQ